MGEPFNKRFAQKLIDNRLNVGELMSQAGAGRHLPYNAVIVKPRLHDTTGCETGCQTGLTTSYMKFHGMLMQIYFSCFLSLMLLMIEEKSILSTLSNHLSQVNVIQLCHH